MSGACAAACGPAALLTFPDLQSEEVASSYYTMKTNGSILHAQNVTGNLKWVRNGAPTNYEVSFAGGAYQDFSSDRTFNVTSTVSLRDKWSLAVVKSVTVTLS